MVFGMLFLLLFGVVATYRIKAQSGRTIDYSKEGRAIFLALRLGGLSICLYCLLYIVYPRALAWSFIDVPAPIRWAGAALVLALIPFVSSAQRALGRNVSPTVVTHDDHALVTSGPYRWIRNPLYTAGAALFTGLGLVSASAFLLVGALVALALVAIRLPSEEAELERRFGEAYRDYVRRTGRFLLRLRQREN
jgi:protein-S-isoprenylcysteine O-methyltransferase Ste14